MNIQGFTPSAAEPLMAQTSSSPRSAGAANTGQLEQHFQRLLGDIAHQSPGHVSQPAGDRTAKSGPHCSGRSHRDGRSDGLAEPVGSTHVHQSNAGQHGRDVRHFERSYAILERECNGCLECCEPGCWQYVGRNHGQPTFDGRNRAQPTATGIHPHHRPECAHESLWQPRDSSRNSKFHTHRR